MDRREFAGLSIFSLLAGATTSLSAATETTETNDEFRGREFILDARADVIVEKDKTAVWTVISESPESPLEDLEKELKEKGNALKVEFLPLE